MQRDGVRCLRDNGVDTPDPDEKGEVDFGGGDGSAVKKDPHFLHAKKCADMKATVPVSVEDVNRPWLTAAQIKAARDFAACLQTNSAPDCPRPGPDGYRKNNNSGISAWDQSSADAQCATRICAPISGNPTNQPPAKGW